MNIITICDGGLNRSVGMAWLLKSGEVSGRQHNAIALSGRLNSKDTIRAMANWADLIIVMEPRMKSQYVPRAFHYKTAVCNVGPDVYGYAKNPALVEYCSEFIRRTGL